MPRITRARTFPPSCPSRSTETARGIACLTGQGECPLGDPADMTLVRASDDDLARARQALEEKVLPAWASRVDDETRQAWNSSVGEIVGLTATAP